jgi:hypothetical protein
MNMKKNIFMFFKKINVLFLAVLMLLVSSCNKQLDIKSSRQANESEHWTKFEDARSHLFGIYGLFRSAVAGNNAHWLYGELRNGDFRSVYRPDLKAVIEGNLNASFPVIQDITNWRSFYAVINACNLFIERVKECMVDPRYTETYFKLDIAQARALRAFAYFYMVRIWGDVPLITRSQDGTFEELPRTNKEYVLSFAEQELIAAAPRLPYLYSGYDPAQIFPNNYYGNNEAAWRNIPITKLAAYALLAHIAAWQGKYIDVATYTDFIVTNMANSKMQVVTTNYLVSSLFNADVSGNYNQLVGFNFIKAFGETTTDGHIEQLTLANTVNYPMSKMLPDIYVPKDIISSMFPLSNGNDERFGVDISSPLQLPVTTYFENYSSAIPVFKKIRVVNGGAGGNNGGQFAVFNSSIVFTRIEEIKLLRAEAMAVLGQKQAAIIELNSIRTVRGLKAVSDVPGMDIVDEVFAERRRELLGEGWRWYDLIRYNRIKRNNPVFNNLLDKEGIYWPISEDVLNRNPKIVQNSYWK